MVFLVSQDLLKVFYDREEEITQPLGKTGNIYSFPFQVNVSSF